jgi:hypothetical protein
MSTKTCLKRIQEIEQAANGNLKRCQQLCREEFKGRSIISNWGQQRLYIVSDVRFDINPSHTFLTKDGINISIADYFFKTYKKQITSPKQPMFVCKMADLDVHLPPEFCLLEGVPQSIKDTREYRDALIKTRSTPDRKCEQVKKMVSDLFTDTSINNLWDLEVEMKPFEIMTSVLPSV